MAVTPPAAGAVVREEQRPCCSLPPKPPALPVIDSSRCTGCGRCVAACPPHVLWLEAERANGWGKKSAVLHAPDDCTGCAQCYAVCPFDVIRMARKP